MRHLSSLKLVVWTSLAAWLVAPADVARAETTPVDSVPPNIVIILADDLGYGDVRCQNPRRGKIATPCLDRLAAQGARFTDAHSSSGVCSPSRYTLLTGRYHWRTRLQSGIVGVWGPPLIAPDRVTIASLAKQRGYRTACVGKWHLGWDWPIAAESKRWFTNFGKDGVEVGQDHRDAWKTVFSQSIGGGPTTRGFDLYFGTDVPNWPPYCFIDNDRTVGVPSALLPASKLRDHQASVQGPALPDWRLEGVLPALGDRARAFITEAAAKPEPFLLYLPLTSPHTPLAVNEAWRGRSRLDNACADLIMETDALVGEVLETLENTGEADNTLVLFTSDNGFAPYVGAKELERRGHFPSGPLRGYKADVYEGGHRVPFFARWPGVVKPGRVCEHLVHHADLLATLAEILGVELPDNAGEDSFSLLPLLRGGDLPTRTHAVSCAANGTPSVRDGAWKLILAPEPGDAGDAARPPLRLYNLADDLGETKNLASAEPERAARMEALLEKLIADGRSTPGARQANDAPVTRHPRGPGTPKTRRRGD